MLRLRSHADGMQIISRLSADTRDGLHHQVIRLSSVKSNDDSHPTTVMTTTHVGVGCRLYALRHFSSYPIIYNTMTTIVVRCVCRWLLKQSSADCFGRVNIVLYAISLSTSPVTLYGVVPLPVLTGTTCKFWYDVPVVKYDGYACSMHVMTGLLSFVSLPRHKLIGLYTMLTQKEIGKYHFSIRGLCPMYISYVPVVCNPIIVFVVVVPVYVSPLLSYKELLCMPFVPTSAREQEIQYLIVKLVENSPYPLRWYEQKSDKQIKAMARKNQSVVSYYDQLVENAVARDEAMIQARLEDQRRHSFGEEERPAIMLSKESKQNIVGHYELTVANRRSLRFKFVRPDGRTDNAIISRLKLSSFAIERGEDCLPRNHLCLVWESGKIVIMPVGTIVGKILGSAINNPRDLVQEIYRVNGSQVSHIQHSSTH